MLSGFEECTIDHNLSHFAQTNSDLHRNGQRLNENSQSFARFEGFVEMLTPVSVSFSLVFSDAVGLVLLEMG